MSLVIDQSTRVWFLLNWLFYLFTFQMLSPFPVSLLPSPHPNPIPLRWGIMPPQDKGPPLPLMSDKAILCYICIWSPGSLHVYSLVGGLVSGSSGWPSLLTLFFLWGCKPLQLLQSFL